MTALDAAASAGGGPPLRSRPALARYLQSIVDTARAIFDAQASSIFLVTDDASELEFVAVSGRGERDLVGRRLPVDTGIAGWVVSSGESLVVDDVEHDPVFDRDAARRTGFVPRSIIAAPIPSDESSLGVIEVLDPTYDGRGSLAELDLLGRFAVQVATALEVLLEAERSTGPTPRAELAALIADALAAAPSPTIERATGLLTQLVAERSGRVGTRP